MHFDGVDAFGNFHPMRASEKFPVINTRLSFLAKKHYHARHVKALDENAQQQIGIRFKNQPVSNQIKRTVGNRRPPTMKGLAGLGLDDFVHHPLLCAFENLLLAVGLIRAGDLPVV